MTLMKSQGKDIIWYYLDTVPAWFPSPWSWESRHKLDLNTYLIERPNSSFLVKVSGDSMIDAGIMDWDMVVVDKSQNANVGDIVIAYIDTWYTIKYLQRDQQGKSILSPANPKYTDIIPESELTIFGVVVSCIRKLK